MKKILHLVLLLIINSIHAQNRQKPVEILLLGTFHFDNPGLDVAQFKNANILSPERQAEIRTVVEKLKKFNPDKLFIEARSSRKTTSHGFIDNCL